MCGQATYSMSTRMLDEGHPPGMLLVFYQLWEQIQGGIMMTVGVIQSQWGAMSWWWNAMIACLKDGISKQPQHTLKDGLTNQKLRHTLFEQVISMISQKVTKCWVTGCDPGNCHHCFCPASHWLNPARSWPAKQGIPIFRKVVAVAAKYRQYIGRDHEWKRE